MSQFDSPIQPNSSDRKQEVAKSYATSCLRANLQQTPNEDFLLVDEHGGIFIVVDGVSRTNYGDEYPCPSPEAMASEKFTQSCYQSLLSNNSDILSARERVIEAIRVGNAEVASLNQDLFGDSIDYLGSDLAGTVGILAIAEHGTLTIGYAGDVRAYGIRDGKVELLTEVQTSKVSELRKGPDGWSDETTLRIRRDIRNNPADEMGFGVFTGEDSALKFVRIIEISFRDYDNILLATDGIAMLAAADIENLLIEDLDSLADKAQEHSQVLGRKVDDIGLIRINCAKYIDR